MPERAIQAALRFKFYLSVSVLGDAVRLSLGLHRPSRDDTIHQLKSQQSLLSFNHFNWGKN